MAKATWFAAAAAVTLWLAASPAMAAYNLQITEIWPGNEPGSNLTEDWFEITNFGDTAWTAAIDGNLWFDDDSFSSSNAVPMVGITSIAPGESVIYVDGGASGASDWLAVWSDVVVPWQVGNYNGAGLGQGGDAVGVWITTTVPAGAPTFTGAYPDASANGGQSYNLTLAAFSTAGNANNAVATLQLNDANQAAIGSPGVPVPEPSSVLLAVAGSALLLLGRRRVLRAARQR